MTNDEKKPPLDLYAALHMLPKDAIAFFESKGYKITFNWQQLWQEAHTKAFTVAGLAKMDILQDIRGALSTALNEGQTEKWFVHTLESVLRKKGWWGFKERVNPHTGEVKKIQQGCPARLGLIYQQNVQTAYMAGRYKQQQENKAFRPYRQYICSMLATSRVSHKALNGQVFHVDDPFWDTHYPPNGWRCRCSTRTLSEFRLKKEGLNIESSQDRMVTRIVETIDRQTGEVHKRTVTGYKLDSGATAWTDVGFSYNCGKSVGNL